MPLDSTRSLKIPDDIQSRIILAAAQGMFRVLDRTMKTYCVFSANVMARTLNNFGIAAQLIPCQLVCLAENRTSFLGFTGAQSHKWDGHVVTRSGDTLIDCAMSGLLSYGIEVPPIAVVPVIKADSALLARSALGDGRFLLWTTPPRSVEVPTEPEAAVRNAVDRLTTYLSERLQFPDPATASAAEAPRSLSALPG